MNDITKDKHFCILPWIHMHIWPNGSTYPCCLATYDYKLGNTNDQTFLEIWNSEKMRELRINVLNSAPTTGCSKCYENENNGAKSMRMSMNENYVAHYPRTEKTNLDGSLDEIYMAYFDIRFSNICNFKCRTCGPDLSSFWVSDAKKLGKYDPNGPTVIKIKNSLSELWEDMVNWIDTVEQIYFAGGEPLIMDEHYKILEYLIEIGKTDILIAYNTNFSKLQYKNKDVLELWKHFKHIKVGASLDAMGERAEYLRAGTVWKDIEENRIRLKEELPNIDFEVSPTVSVYNALHFTDFLDDWISKGWVQPGAININTLLYPEYQRAQILPKSVKIELQAKIERFMQRHDISETNRANEHTYRSLVAFLNSIAEDKSDIANTFINKNHFVDELRNEILFDVFPELKCLVKNDSR